VEKIWLKNYPKGVPAEIDVNEYASVRDVFEDSVAKYAKRPAYTCMGKSITFTELDVLSAAFGAHCKARAAANAHRADDANILQYRCACSLRAGCTVVNVNPLYTPRELEHQLKDSGAEMLVVLENFAHVAQEVLPKTQVKQTVVTSIGEFLRLKGIAVDFALRRVKKMVPPWSIPGAIRLSQALAQGRKRSLARVPLGHDDIAFLQYTGGTTGVAKGAMLLHRNIVANLLQARAWIRPFLDPKQREIVITPLPLYTSSR
jgi:long-chain acyl-CoA synthetase